MPHNVGLENRQTKTTITNKQTNKIFQSSKTDKLESTPLIKVVSSTASHLLTAPSQDN